MLSLNESTNKMKLSVHLWRQSILRFSCLLEWSQKEYCVIWNWVLELKSNHYSIYVSTNFNIKPFLNLCFYQITKHFNSVYTYMKSLITIYEKEQCYGKMVYWNPYINRSKQNYTYMNKGWRWALPPTLLNLELKIKVNVGLN